MLVEAQVTINGSKAAVWAAITNRFRACSFEICTVFGTAAFYSRRSGRAADGRRLGDS
jgi:hypothetical protein